VRFTGRTEAFTDGVIAVADALVGFIPDRRIETRLKA
jgi:hypothetical protein